MKNDLDPKAWEYLWYFLVTALLLAAGLFMLLWAVAKMLVGLLSKRRFSIKQLVLPAIVAAVGVTVLMYYRYVEPIDVGARRVVIQVTAGETFSQVARKIQAEGIVRSRFLLSYAAALQRLDKKLRTGQYQFTGENSCRSVLRKLASGDILLTRVTIVEGEPIWEVASSLAEQLGLDSAAVMTVARDSALLDSLSVPSLEGYLFPETYYFSPGITVRQAVSGMVAMFHAKTDSLWRREGPNGLSPREIMILASIVQAESGREGELAVISAVYQNRLKLGMTLDADPTVIYGLGGLDRPLQKNDIALENPYNTYQKYGLPPTPINSPGLAAIAAALHPDSSGYLYFVADGNGGHLFSNTNEEHNRLRARVRAAERRKR